MVLRMARLTHDADYDAGETSGKVPCPRSFPCCYVGLGRQDSIYDSGSKCRCAYTSLEWIRGIYSRVGNVCQFVD
ncbi:unnamed protein product [Protopolystoma xenopodis]|uniref:Uncharacterized protein n=1 Tax=Protopolystoma xenopodis TaxID=117903 RepID=A0A448XHW3_9PLAT|nr:unnamed protein product [Protopolystoma xenopodis]